MELLFLDKAVLLALSAACEAGKAILQVYNSKYDVNYKDDQSPLTDADRWSHEIISRALSTHNPALDSVVLPLLSEEGSKISHASRKSWESFWLVDPLDGTKEFLKRNGEFTVNIALIKGTRPVLGVIYAPAMNVIYYALKDFGAYRLNIDPMVGIIHSPSCSTKATGEMSKILDRSRKLMPQAAPVLGSKVLVVGSRSHGSAEIDKFKESMRKIYDPVEFISAGSSLKFCLVAEGKADLYPRFGPTMEWDTAAGQIIVEEAGGQVLGLESASPLEYNKAVLLNPAFIVIRDGMKGVFGFQE